MRMSADLAPWARPVHDALIKALDLRRNDVDRLSDEALRVLTRATLARILDTCGLPAHIDREMLGQFVLAEALGLGPLESLIADESVSEIMVNRVDEVYVERAGTLARDMVAFSSPAALRGVIERIVIPVGRRIDESSPMVDARLPDGSRVNVVIPPLALKGPAITIRKFPSQKLTADHLVRRGSLSRAMLQFLTFCVHQRRNLIVSGGTGTGKTTLLNILATLIPAAERLVTIEDAAELALSHGNLVCLESRAPNLEGQGEVTIRDLVRNALRMRPDRIIVGECRGGEALDMLQAMNTGHEGSLTTAHANSPRDLLSRIEVMVLMAGMDLPITAVREQIASALHVIVQQARFPCGTRVVTRIVEVTGIESGIIQTQDIFRFERTGTDQDGHVTGRFRSTGHIPAFYEKLREHGARPELSIFEADGETTFR